MTVESNAGGRGREGKFGRNSHINFLRGGFEAKRVVNRAQCM